MRRAIDFYEFGREAPPVPNHTPSRNVRVSDELWMTAVRKATDQGVTVTSVIIDALEAYVNEPGGMRSVPRSLEELVARLNLDRTEQLAVMLIKKLRAAGR